MLVNINCLTCLSGQVSVPHQVVMDQVTSMDDLLHIEGAGELLYICNMQHLQSSP